MVVVLGALPRDVEDPVQGPAEGRAGEDVGPAAEEHASIDRGLSVGVEAEHETPPVAVATVQVDVYVGVVPVLLGSPVDERAASEGPAPVSGSLVVADPAVNAHASACAAL